MKPDASLRKRADQYGGSEVRPGVWLSGVEFAENTELLRALSVRHVLTVLKGKTRVLGRGCEDIGHTVIEEDDVPPTDLLSHFETAADLIDRERAEERTVLVHCQVGRSRSATLVAAWLVRSEGLSAEDALRSLREVRPVVQPNVGFKHQLGLWAAMGADLYADRAQGLRHPEYQRFLLQKAAKDMARKNGGVIKFPVARDPLLASRETPNPLSRQPEGIFRCRKCRRHLFTSDLLSRHSDGGGTFSSRPPASRPTAEAQDEDAAVPEGTGEEPGAEWCGRDAHHVFPTEWMGLEGGAMEGKLYCPKCRAKVGGFDWKGKLCGCGAWVAPWIHLPASNIDFSPNPLSPPPSDEPPDSAS